MNKELRISNKWTYKSIDMPETSLFSRAATCTGGLQLFHLKEPALAAVLFTSSVEIIGKTAAELKLNKRTRIGVDLQFQLDEAEAFAKQTDGSLFSWLPVPIRYILSLEQILPPVINSFSDQDSRVRNYACEALYNIAKVVRGEFIFQFNNIFDALCKLSANSDPNVQSAAHLLDRLVKDIVTESDQFSIEEFIPLLRERMNVLNPYVRQFLVGWITVLDSVPDIDMLGFLPDFLDGLFNMLSDSSLEIRQQADSALSEFLQEIKNSPAVDYGRMAEILVQRASSSDEFTRWTAITWINEFVKLGGDQLVPYYSDILGAILPCIADKEEKIRVVARETNDELREIQADPAEGFDVGAILSIARRCALAL
ncbi:hypothetical protein L1987_69141 [Smallanthus sonchifolius]|uniref:Uncharacterized protein n=1 Tax=Smallanthus sonchifolius TaxID=185202 RepID=A0ACB9B5Z1_9ASTR|nr:hypothetical protein L1987_69141 [Smallanthus sonchifolius]